MLGERMRRRDKGANGSTDTISAAAQVGARLTPTPRCTGWCGMLDGGARPALVNGPRLVAWRPRMSAWPTRAMQIANEVK